jgi:hypothetical protein
MFDIQKAVSSNPQSCLLFQLCSNFGNLSASGSFTIYYLTTTIESAFLKERWINVSAIDGKVAIPGSKLAPSSRPWQILSVTGWVVT